MVLDLANAGPAIVRELEQRGIAGSADAFQRLYDLYEAVRVLKLMNYFLVTDQDADKVLEVFVPVNSGGTTLSYSDLLLSMATNQRQELDAREEVRSLVKRGIWGSGLDTLLTRIRDVLRTNSTNGFPVAAVEEAMAAVGKSLAFDAAEIDELLNLKYAG
ncbi:hypothetical protein [Devriesea agamarum]|uniref:hypothetical protein n=1 Tax=Devriesea agamarum TaxID=472569 RepID=UPI000AA77D81|nr:hypothetical protein [Devriesea agamarum]